MEWKDPTKIMPNHGELVVVKTDEKEFSYTLAVYYGHRQIEVPKKIIEKDSRKRDFYNHDEEEDKWWTPMGFYGHSNTSMPWWINDKVKLWIGLPGHEVEDAE